MMKQSVMDVRPSSLELEQEWKRERYRLRYRAVMCSTICTLIVVAAAAVLVATFWMPVLQIYGSSMTPTLEDGQIVLGVKRSELEPGDIVAFYCNNKILVKRVIAGAGDWVDMKEDGTVLVNGEMLEEPYLTEKSPGISDVEFPCQVPEERIFVMGDQRGSSLDSRHSVVGFVSDEMIVGEIVCCIWPLEQFGRIGLGVADESET